MAVATYQANSSFPQFHAQEEFDDLYHEPIFDNPFLPPSSDDSPLNTVDSLEEPVSEPTYTSSQRTEEEDTQQNTPTEPIDGLNPTQSTDASDPLPEVVEPSDEPELIPQVGEEKAQILELLKEILRQEKDILTADQLLLLEEKFAAKYKKKLKKAKKEIKQELHDAEKALEERAREYLEQLPTVESLKEQLEEKRAEKLQEMEAEAEVFIAAHQEQLEQQLQSKLQLVEQMTAYEARVSLNELRAALVQEEERAADKREAFIEYLNGRVSQLSEDASQFQQLQVRNNSSRIQDLLILSIGDRLRMNQSYTTPLNELRSVTKEGGPLAEVLDRFPSEAPQQSLGQLIESFAEMKKEARWLSFLPSDGRRNLRDRVVANVFSSLTVPLKGKAQGNDTEAILARAEYYLHKGNVFQAIQTLQRLQGPPREVIYDWCASSADYLQTQGALRDLQAGL